MTENWLRKGRPLDQHLRDEKQNNFKLIRLVCALLVILSHCYGGRDPLYLLTGGLLGGSAIAMPVFFFLSGLLVAQSLAKSSSRGNFLWKRFLRLYPAAVVAVLLTACLIGPLVTSLPPQAYFTHPLFFRYLRTILLVEIYFRLPGVFTHSPLGPSVNSSLWSLSLEWKCYAGLFLVSFIKRKTLYISLLLLLLVLLITTNIFYAPIESAGKAAFGPYFALSAYSRLAAYFLIGVLCYHFRDKINIHIIGWPLAILLAGMLSARWGFFPYAAFLLLPAAVLYASVNGLRTGLRLTPRPDLSYGIYVWGFPIEQLVVNYLHPSNHTLLFLLTLALTLPLALLSWRLVESPALKMKRRTTGRPAEAHK